MRSLVPLLVLTALAVSLALLASGAQIPTDALSLRDRGLALLENEQPAEAERVYRQLVEKVPAEPLGWANLAIALLRQQKGDDALEAISKALELAPGRGDLKAIEGEVHQWSGRPEEALEAYRQAAILSFEDVEIVHSLHRQAAAMSGETAESATDQALRQLSRLRPDNLVVLLRLGQHAVARGERATASSAYLRVRELLWQAPPVAGRLLDQVLEALEADDFAAARVPSLRLENVLKITAMFRQGQRELATGIQGIPVARFDGESAPSGFGAPVEVSFAAARLAEGATAALATGDFDGDQRTDVARVTGTRLEVFLAASGFEAKALPGAAPAGAELLLAADLDNDGRLDLVASGRSTAAWRGTPDGFEVVADGFGLSKTAARAGVAVDYDIEGDLDLLLAGAGGAELFRNALTGPLEAVGGRSLPSDSVGEARSALASDLDRDGDLDLVLAGEGGIQWLDNLRQGRFVDRTEPAGLASAADLRGIASADLDSDGQPELITAGQGVTVWANDGGRFAPRAVSAIPSSAKSASIAAFDADNDGQLDLAVAGQGGAGGGLSVLANRGGRFSSISVAGAPAGAEHVAAADLDGDGDQDLILGGADGLFRVTNEGGNKNRWLALRLRGLAEGNSKNNALGLGSVVEVRAGDGYQFREAQGDVVHFGLGQRSKAEVLRVVWTNGVPQNRLDLAGDQTVVEEQLLKGSCPFLYTWDGERMRFVTDLLWGAPIGLPVAAGAWAGADPTELVKVDGARADEEGRYRMVVTEELWEAAFFDRARLWVVDHPTDVEVASSLKIVPGSAIDEEVLGARELRPVASAWDGEGHDVTARVERRDEIYADGYSRSPYQGVAPEWSFTFDLGAAPAAPVRLFLEGWIFPADASLNLAVDQRSDLPPVTPRLEVETATGWQVLLPMMGHPAGKTKTMVVDTPTLPRTARRLRIVSSLWLSWDRIAWTTSPDDGAARVVARLDPASAELGHRGFSRLVRMAPNAPHAYDFEQVSTESPWLPLPGRYTRHGDVRPLLVETDDLSVILAPGDAMELVFDASALPAPPPGTRRTVFLESHGWDKDADRNTHRADGVEPLPFRAMTGYPYAEGEAFPDTPATRNWRQEWLTREVRATGGGRALQ